MAKAETSSKTRERPLNQKERSQFVGQIAGHIRKRSEDLVLTTSWREIEPYVELVGMMGLAVADESLDSRQQSHLRKMIAVQYTMVPHSRTRLRAQEFLTEVRNVAGQEIEEAQILPDDLQKMPAAWRNAYNDTIKVQTDLDIH
jgi:hypothetical protein